MGEGTKPHVRKKRKPPVEIDGVGLACLVSKTNGVQRVNDSCASAAPYYIITNTGMAGVPIGEPTERATSIKPGKRACED